MAQVTECLTPTVVAWIKFLAPVFGPAEPHKRSELEHGRLLYSFFLSFLFKEINIF